MPHTYVSQVMHCVFSTKGRQKLITPELQERLWPYLGGIAREHKMKALAIGGIEDHLHLLLSLPSTMALAKAMQLIKGGSSKWIHDTFPEHRRFEWQEGYGAFSVSVTNQAKVMSYIDNQATHHANKDFKEEFLDFLQIHDIEYDERYIWD